MKRWALLLSVLLCSGPLLAQTLEISAETLRDKIRGGFVGQVLGDLNGLKHEMKYIAEPGNVTQYVPSLPEGAWTDDDTDFEWVYLVEMQRAGRLVIPYDRVARLWKEHINRRFWCANEYARQLMDLGIDPPLTGKIAFNPWSDFNISGQFVSESFGLMSPGMPQTAARLGLHYTHVTIEGEPAQSTQLFTAMIATAFVTDDMEKILDAGAAALDPKSILRQIIKDVREWHRLYPRDWRSTRSLIKDKYTRFGGAERDRNGHELNTANVIASLLYGKGEFVETAITAFNFGWDADNDAATACTILGVLKGYRWMMAQNWTLLDKYRNTSRDAMPENETITSYADRIFELARRNILENGGTANRIRLQSPANVEPLADPKAEFARLRAQLRPEIESALGGPGQARAAYLAICLDLAAEMRQKHGAQWTKALAALNSHSNVMQVLFFPRVPAGVALREKALAAGLQPPAKQEPVWQDRP